MIKALFILLLSSISLVCLGMNMPSSGHTSIKMLSGLLNDPGGSGNYGHHLNSTLTILPELTNGKVKLKFFSFRTEKDKDYLYVYNGRNADIRHLMFIFSGTNIPSEITSSDSSGALTLVFTSDQDISYEGFSAEILNEDCANYSGQKAFASTPWICPDYPFTLYLHDTLASTNTNVQWQSSLDGITWDTLPGANSNRYNISQSTAKYYRAVLSCPTSNAGTFTSSVFVGNSKAPCYCSQLLGGDVTFNMSLVSISGTSLNKNHQTNRSKYHFFPPINNWTTSLAKGNEYELNVVLDDYYQNISAWIDYDQDGQFEPEEWMSVTRFNSTFTANTVKFQIPLDAKTGMTGMRIRSHHFAELKIPNNSRTGFAPDTAIAKTSCKTFSQGNTEDYYINLIEPSSCSNPILAGKTISDKYAVCPTNPFALSLIGSDTSSNLLYQWQTTDDETTGWTDIANANSNYLKTIQDSAGFYRCKISCGSSSVFSTPTFVDIDTNKCNYLVPLTGEATIKTCDGFLFDNGGNGNYSDFADGVITILPSTPNASVQLSFSELQFESNADTLILFDGALSSSSAVEINKTPFSYTSTNPEGSLSLLLHSDLSFTFKGFKAKISCVSRCEQNLMVTTQANVSKLCRNELLMLSLSSIPDGAKYMWEKSTNGNNWITLTGDTLPQLNTKQTVSTTYRCKIDCGTTPTWSSPIRIEMDGMPCYCVQNLNEHACNELSNQNILNVTVEGTSLNHTSTCNPSLDSSNISIFKESSSSTTSLNKNQLYTLSITCQKENMNISAWIDYDQDGFF